MTDYGGRSTRSELLYFLLLAVLAGNLVSFLTSGTRYTGDENVRSLFLVFFIVPMIPLLVRRLHDQARSGWWLLAGLPALGGVVVEQWLRHSGAPSLLSRSWDPVLIILSALWVLVLALLPPDERANRYGANPRQVEVGERG